MLGMGLLNGKRMSASRGNAILARDLIVYYGPNKARLIIILGGGHPSKAYNYDKTLPAQSDKLLNNFTNYYNYLTSLAGGEIRPSKIESANSPVKVFSDIVEENINKGYYRQAIIELLAILPTKYETPTCKTARLLMSVYEKYLDVLLPGLLNSFEDNRGY
jgi:leucyl-tRNA synthetase